MTIEEIVHGESKNVEFKVSLPKDSAKYMKTIIAFANTQGGRLVSDRHTTDELEAFEKSGYITACIECLCFAGV